MAPSTGSRLSEYATMSSGFKIWLYKYIGIGSESEKNIIGIKFFFKYFVFGEIPESSLKDFNSFRKYGVYNMILGYLASSKFRTICEQAFLTSTNIPSTTVSMSACNPCLCMYNC